MSESLPQITPEALAATLHDEFQQVIADLAQVVNAAPNGQLIAASEEKVRDLFARFRASAFQTAIQMRIDEAEASFPPSTRCQGPVLSK